MTINSAHLAEYYRRTKASDQVHPDVFEAANEAAIDAIMAAGFDGQDSDTLGKEMSDDVQTLLTLAFVRCPDLTALFSA